MIQADTLEAQLRGEAKTTVEGARARLKRLDVVQSTVLRGRPASAIVDRARDMGVRALREGSV